MSYQPHASLVLDDLGDQPGLVGVWFDQRLVDGVQPDPHKSIEPHFDDGKHLYWKALGRNGERKAQRLGLLQGRAA